MRNSSSLRGGQLAEAELPRLFHQGDEPISGYRLVRYVGRGGVGEVWEAQAPGGVLKAIKLIPTENTETLLTTRELQGLEKIKSIRHPYLLAIDRYEQVQGYIIVVMELADRSLADRFDECVDQGMIGIPRDELLRYMVESSEVLDLLSQTHGLQHLDIKPENLFLSAGHIKVADFGLVQPEKTELAFSSLAFTPAYAPPELFRGRIETTADQYSLAVTYQELLTGRRPYSANSFRELVFQHANEGPDLSLLPPHDQAILSRALSRDLTLRYRNCQEFVEALRSGAVTDTVVVSDASNVFEAKGREFQPTRVASAKSAVNPAKPLFTRAKRDSSAAVGKKAHIAPGKSGFHRPIVPNSPTTPSSQDSTAPAGGSKPPDSFRNSFLACLPLEIYARKLRAFIDAIEAEIVTLSPEETVLKLRPKPSSVFAFRKDTKALFLRMEIYHDGSDSDHNVVQVTIWSSDNFLQGPELTQKAILLLRCLKAYMMATEKKGNVSIDPKSVMAAVWKKD